MADGGQALVFALIVVLIMGLLPAIVLMGLNDEMPAASEAVNSESALGAAEAGIQEYSNLMDQYPGYYTYAPRAGGATAVNDPGPPALPGGTNLALGAWQAVSPSNPQEDFTYYPDYSDLDIAKSGVNPFGGNVLLIVTGRAGTGKTTQYRRIEAAFSLSGVITDVYFSNFEQPGYQDLDQWENTFSGCSAAGVGCAHVTSGSHEYDESQVTTPVGFSPSESMATALCEYDATSINTFIDWYSTNVQPIVPLRGYPGYDTATPYSAANPYYGPWYGSFVDPGTSYWFGDDVATGSGTNNGDASACSTNYWITGDTFNGPVFSNDELTTCGSPAFNANPGLQTSVSKSFYFPAEKTAGGTLVGWPGAEAPIANPNVPAIPPYVSKPYGYDDDPWGDCAAGEKPTFTDPQSPRLGISQPLPPANQSLITEVEDGAVAGCVYSGPTMIRFSYDPSGVLPDETMSVWSPLTKNTYQTSPTGIDTTDGVICGMTTGTGAGDLCAGDNVTCTAATSQVNSAGTVVAGNWATVPVNAEEVIVVQNSPAVPQCLCGGSPTLVNDPNFWATSAAPLVQALPTAEPQENPVGTGTTTLGGVVSGCIDPWVNPDSGLAITNQTCSAGDAIISGAVGAQVTLSASNDIVLARSVVYGCAVTSNLTATSYGTYPAMGTNLASCASSNNVLGLIALNNIWMSQPVVVSSDTMAPTCTDDNDMKAASVTWNNMIPNCTVANPTIDAAMASLQGFFEVEYWKEGHAAGGQDTITFNGSDAVNNSGQFGSFSGSTLSTGYYLTLNYDSRLIGDPPPQYLPATDGVWNEVGWVTCPSTSPNPDSNATYPADVINTTADPAGTSLCTLPSNFGNYPPTTIAG